MSSYICWPPQCKVRTQQTRSSVWSSLSAKTVRTRGLSSPNSALVCKRKLADFPVSEPISTSSLPCFKCTEIALWKSTFFLPVPFMCHPWACFPFSLTCSFQPLSLMLLPWTTLAASTVGVLSLWFGFFFLHLLPRTPPAAKAALVPACIT